MAISQEQDEAVKQVLECARALRAEGKYAEAIDLLGSLEEEGKFYPPAVMMQANLYRTLGKLEEGRHLLELLEAVYPEEPTVLFNLSGVWWELGDNEKARFYLARLEESLEGREVAPEFQEKVNWLKRQVEGPVVDVDVLLQAVAEKWREEVEVKPLPVDPGLARGLKNMPAIWLNGMCAEWGIEPARTRQKREKQIIAHLGDAGNLERIVTGLDEESTALLRYLLENGGWRRINAVPRKFGSLEGDGYFWNERRPTSPLGALWSRALVCVGQARIDGRHCRITIIPVELRERLSLPRDSLSKSRYTVPRQPTAAAGIWAAVHPYSLSQRSSWPFNGYRGRLRVQNTPRRVFN